MVHLKLTLLAASGGAMGSAARYLSNAAALALFGPGFPWATFFVNVVGSFAMGIVTGLAIHRSAIGPDMRLFLTTGILGGFTTFSAFALDTHVLFGKSPAVSAVYVGSSVGLAMAALYFGLALTK